MSKSKNVGLNITISHRSQEILNKFVELKYFGSVEINIAKIAISYAIGNNYDKEYDLDNYVIERPQNKWALGGLKESYFEDVIEILRPDVKNINMALRNLIDIGLLKMYEDLYDESIDRLNIEKLFELKL